MLPATHFVFSSAHPWHFRRSLNQQRSHVAETILCSHRQHCVESYANPAPCARSTSTRSLLYPRESLPLNPAPSLPPLRLQTLPHLLVRPRTQPPQRMWPHRNTIHRARYQALSFARRSDWVLANMSPPMSSLLSQAELHQMDHPLHSPVAQRR